MPQSIMTARSQPAASHGLVTVDGRWFPLRSAAVQVTAEGGLAATTLVQQFTNPHAEPLEVLYTLPLPADGAVIGYDVRIGDKTIRGEVRPKAEAKMEYRKAIAEGRTASLLEQHRADTFSQSLGSVPPGQDVELRIEILQPLGFVPQGEERGAFWEYRFPTVVGVRYNGADGRVTDREQLDTDRADGSGTPVRISLELHVGDGPAGAIHPESPSHALNVETTDGGARIGLAGPSEDARLDRDLVVRWKAVAADVGVSARLGGGLPGDEGRYALVTLAPPANPSEVVARDVTILLDASGSMGGEPLQQAKAVIRAVLGTLEPFDRFELLAFADTTKRLIPGPVTASREHIDQAYAALDGLLAGGGTEMTRAIVEALAPAKRDAQRQVIVLTDGYIGFESEVVGEVVTMTAIGNARLHVVGIGAAPNRSLTRSLARGGGGAEILVGQGDDPVGAGIRLVQATSRPVLTEIQITGTAVMSHTPTRLPDVMAEQPLLLAAELTAGGGTLTLRGRLAGSEEPWVREIAMPAETPVKTDDAVAMTTRLPVGALFGRWTIEDLELRLACRQDPTLAQGVRTAIETTAMRHRIASSETSLVAIAEEPSVDPRHPRRREKLPTELPAGLSAEGVGLVGPTTMAFRSVGDSASLLDMEIQPRRVRIGAVQSPRDRLSVTEPSAGTVRIDKARVLRTDGDLLIVEFEVPSKGFGVPRPDAEGDRVRIRLADGTEMIGRIDRNESTAPGRQRKGLTIRLAVRLDGGSWSDGAVTLFWKWELIMFVKRVPLALEIPVIIGATGSSDT